MKLHAAWAGALALGLAPGLVPGGAAAQGTAAPDATDCQTRDVNGMITVVVCPPGLAAIGWQAAGRIACGDRQPCLAWIWDDADLAPETAAPTSEELGGEALATAVAVWVNDDRQLIPMDAPYVGIGGDEGTLDDLDDPLLPLPPE